MRMLEAPKAQEVLELNWPLVADFLTRFIREELSWRGYEKAIVAVSGGVDSATTLALAVLLSAIALTWNYAFNWVFERWEARQVVRGRSLLRRLAHGVGFEGGLTVLLVPVMSIWLEISPLEAFIANLGLLAFFFVYAVGFTWVFDKVFGLPASAAVRNEG